MFMFLTAATIIIGYNFSEENKYCRRCPLVKRRLVFPCITIILVYLTPKYALFCIDSVLQEVYCKSPATPVISAMVQNREP